MARSQEPRSCGVILVTGNPIRSFLLMKHADRWDLPKGHVDPGETDVECALRELEEETGVSPAAVTLDLNFQFEQQYEVSAARYGGSKNATCIKTLVVFLGRVENEFSINVTEHEDFQWFPWSPPHHIQTRAIDPILAALENYVSERHPVAPPSPKTLQK